MEEFKGRWDKLKNETSFFLMETSRIILFLFFYYFFVSKLCKIPRRIWGRYQMTQNTVKKINFLDLFLLYP